MGTTLTEYLDWSKPVYPSDNLSAELDALVDEIDADVASLGGSWSVSDDGVEMLSDPTDLDFGNGISVTDDGDGTVSFSLDAIAESDLAFATATQAELDSHAGTGDAHHTRYADSEALAAVNADADHGSTAPHDYFSGSHTDLSSIGASDHHTRYADSEAVSAVNAETNLSVDITGSADMVDGNHIYYQSTEPSNPSDGDIWIQP